MADEQYAKTVKLRGGGEIRITCTAPVFNMTAEDRELVVRLLKVIDDFEMPAAKEPTL